jgi:hypothetical protein
MVQGSFSAQVSAWAKMSEARTLAVFRQSAQTVTQEVKKTKDRGGHMPVDTGFLRASLMASTSAMPNINPAATSTKGQSHADDNSQVEMVIANAKADQVIYLGFTASYARYREYKDGFVRLTAQRWKQIVAQSAKLIESRVKSR